MLYVWHNTVNTQSLFFAFKLYMLEILETVESTILVQKKNGTWHKTKIAE